jgi:predicted Zn-dependent protease
MTTERVAEIRKTLFDGIGYMKAAIDPEFKDALQKVQDESFEFQHLHQLADWFEYHEMYEQERLCFELAEQMGIGDSDVVNYRIGFIDMNHGHLASAIQYFQRVRSPTPLGIIMLARTLFISGSKREAREYLANQMRHSDHAGQLHLFKNDLPPELRTLLGQCP